MTIIKVPSCWMLWIPGVDQLPSTWINLANADRVEISDDEKHLTIWMQSGSCYEFFGVQAESILETLEGEFFKIKD